MFKNKIRPIGFSFFGWGYGDGYGSDDGDGYGDGYYYFGDDEPDGFGSDDCDRFEGEFGSGEATVSTIARRRI